MLKEDLLIIKVLLATLCVALTIYGIGVMYFLKEIASLLLRVK